MAVPDAFQHRLHLERAMNLYWSGIIKMRGQIVAQESPSPSEKAMSGTVLIVETDSIDTAKGVLETDLYYTGGVWDKEKLMIIPFSPTVM